jgi:SPX domain protein involved in polyphosphate accumulation
MAIEIFNRYENKYVVSEKTALRLQDRLSEYMELDAYNKLHDTYSISNLYYDTEDSHLIRTSLSKPKYKEKLRLRAYGVPDGNTNVYVEIKKKVNRLVNKRRSAMTLDEAYSFLQSGRAPEIRPGMNRQVVGEIEYFLQTCDINPMICLSYERRAYFGVGQHDLRVSFDTNILTRRYDLRLESGIYGAPLLDGDCWLMEIKVAQSIPFWLCQLLSEYEIYPVSFSKYGTEYKQMLKSAINRRSKYAFIPAAAYARDSLQGGLTAAIAQ